MPVASISRLLWRESVPSLSYGVMLILSGMISTLGLMAGSAATVIGAMIIAPLMGPIIGMAYAITMANRRLLKRAGLTLGVSVVLLVISSAAICWVTGLQGLNDEIVARTEPTLIDLGVALAAGAAGAFAKSRKQVADAFPGVAISVALVPPISVIGIGIAQANPTVIVGSTLLFATNLTGILLSGMLIFIWQRYGSWRRAQGGILASAAIMAVLGIPLGFSLRHLLIQSNTRQQVRELVRQGFAGFESGVVEITAVVERQGILWVEVAIAAPLESVGEQALEDAQQRLSQELGRSVALKVQLIPVRRFSIEP